MTNNIKKYSYKELKDDLGRYRTQSLFWELRFREDEEKYPCFFSLKDYDLEKEGIIYPSLKKIYLSYDHIPGFEYDFALEVFNSWDHWQRLANDTVPMIKKEIKAWRDLWSAGHGVGGVKEVCSVSELVQHIAVEYDGALKRELSDSWRTVRGAARGRH